MQIKYSSKIYSFLLFSIITLCFFASHIKANGSASNPGVAGNEVSISDNKSIDNLIVDEQVILNGIEKSVKVVYSINNVSSTPIKFTMTFPIEILGDTCQTVKDYYGKEQLYDSIDFSAELNGIPLKVQDTPIDAIKLDSGYLKLAKSVCRYKTFYILLQPGTSTLKISYNLIFSRVASDGYGTNWWYKYSIWPAKNWVSKFRHALWRVILPQDFIGSRYFHQYDDWYTEGPDPRSDEWQKKIIQISSPGTRRDYNDHVDFVADDFTPSGSISINLKFVELSVLINPCNEADEHCDMNSLKAFLQIRPYQGNIRCYTTDDLFVVRGNGGITVPFYFRKFAPPFLRNEIFARKGYTFNSINYKTFFSEMTWYKSNAPHVDLNAIEKWNVDFMQKIENTVRNDDVENQMDDQNQIEDIFQAMLKTCPDGYTR